MKKEIKVNRFLYPREAVLKAAYHFIDRCYVHVDLVENDYLLEITPKNGVPVNDIAGEFENELLSQTVRFQVYQQTHTIREILMARAMSSTLTGSNTELDSRDLPDQVENLESILMDWFENNEK